MQFSIISPKGIEYQGDVQSAILPTQDGLLGIEESHAPLVAILAPGTARLTCQEGPKEFAVTGGLLRIETGAVTVLSD